MSSHPSQTFSKKKCRRILSEVFSAYRRKGKKLPTEIRGEFETHIKGLREALDIGDEKAADSWARALDHLYHEFLPRTRWEGIREMVIAIIFALIVATIVRQMWFEPYEVPTGSMRPTLKEQDRFFASKTDFGINVPLAPDQFYFDPDLVKRNNIFIFTVEDLPAHDPDTTYFYLFPGKKRLIKRCLGKPGDILYFYGGQIYGIDKDGEEILDYADPQLSKIDHVPFITFEGRVDNISQSPALVNSAFVLRQMNIPLAKISWNLELQPQAELLVDQKWISDCKEPDAEVVSCYGDFWGMKNFAMAKLITPKELDRVPGINLNGLEPGILYLELQHMPSLAHADARTAVDQMGQSHLILSPQVTWVPLQQEHLDAIMNGLTTSRFVVKDGLASRYHYEGQSFDPRISMRLPDVENGTYEFFSGRADSIHFGGITKDVPEDSPLYKNNPEHVLKLFNDGVRFDKRFSRLGRTSRYAYFRDGELYVMGTPIMKEDDPSLASYIQREETLAAQSSPSNPYFPFVDRGPPLKEDGTLDVDFIKSYGLQIPAESYLALGDNYPSSGDSREFGFVPGKNLRGAMSFLLWPPGDRWGWVNQPGYPLMNLPKFIVWSFAAFAVLVYYLWNRWRTKRGIDSL